MRPGVHETISPLDQEPNNHDNHSICLIIVQDVLWRGEGRKRGKRRVVLRENLCDLISLRQRINKTPVTRNIFRCSLFKKRKTSSDKRKRPKEYVM